MSKPPKLMVGNWKMHGDLSTNAAFVAELTAQVSGLACRAALCVPAVYLAQMQALLAASPGEVGAQDLSAPDAA